MEYLGFVGNSFKIRDEGLLYVEACDSADQVIIASGKNLKELEKNFKANVDKFYDEII